MAAFAALTLAGMTSCSNDDELMGFNSQEAAEKEVITYNPSQDGAVATRGIATTAANYVERITDFQVFAYASDGMGRYVGTSDSNGTVITGDGNRNWGYDDETQTQYWPQYDLDFQAVTPATDNSFTLVNTPVNGSPRLTADVTVPTTVTAQKDIMFAAAVNKNNRETGAPLDLTFRHALSQVAFAGKVAKATISAEVHTIELVNIHNKGNVGFRTAVNTLSAATTGNAAATFGLGLVAEPMIPKTATDVAVNLTANDGALMMIPQEVSRWTTTKAIDGSGTAVPITTADNNHNAYLKIQCKVKDENSGAYLMGAATGTDEWMNVYIPFEVSWELGKKYTYTLVFGNGSGGYDEEGNPLTNMIPITYTVVAADDWQEADGGELTF